MYHLNEKKCTACGECCQALNEIIIFPEEIPKMQELAKDLNITLILDYESVIIDKKNKDLLVVTYSFRKNESDLCPFFNNNSKMCNIYEKRPKSCRSLPLTSIQLDNENTNILLLGPCGENYPELNLEILQRDFPEKFVALQNYFNRYQKAMVFIGNLAENGEIELDLDQNPENLEDKMNSWNKVNIEPKN